MKPALTAEEWAKTMSTSDMSHFDRWDMWENIEDRPHAIAALCLHEEPFGFTREDVEALRWGADNLCGGSHSVEFRMSVACASLANRIEALLSPEE